MTCREPVSVEYLKSCISYDPETGVLKWKWRSDVPKWWNTRFAGSEALASLDKHGYKTGLVRRIAVKAHRAAWAIYYGE